MIDRFVPAAAKALLLAVPALGAFGSAEAATFFVRTDGGDASQCNGRGDAPYPGSGSAQNCAWKHPYYALPSSGTARIAGGDTLLIGSGEYMIGYGAPGATCTTGDRTGCWIGKIPSGTTSARTRILGNGTTAPKLWGTEGNSMILNLNGSSNVEIGNLEITDKSACVVRHNVAAAACGTGGTYAQYGVYAYNSGNVWMHDVNIHGMGHTGLNAGKLTNWTIERTKINANGWAGWDSNVGSDGSNSGQMILRDIEVAWNGCGQNPTTGAAVNCWGQVSGGYGDGIGLNTTGGQWLVEDAFIHHNASDGLDFLYLDGAANTSVIFRRVYSVANAGNQIKSLGNTTIENSVLVSSCGYWNGILKNGEVCRASGNTISVTPSANTVITIRHNTISGEGDNLILTREGVASGKVYIQNNALIGQTDFLAAQSGWPDDKSAAHYAYNDASTVSFAGNLVWNVKNNQCPTGSICGQEPKLKNITVANFDGIPLAGSPVIDKVAVMADVRTDFLEQQRPLGANSDIGAYEGTSAASAPPPGRPTAGDVNGDGKSDLQWHNPTAQQMDYWLMQGISRAAIRSKAVANQYYVIAKGDFNGDARQDLVWTSADRNLWMWQAEADGTYRVLPMGTLPASHWSLVGAGDVNGDGKSDLLWHSTTAQQFDYWIMDGPTRLTVGYKSVASRYFVVASGDFNGDRRIDLVWTSTDLDVLWMWTSQPDGSFAVEYVSSYPTGGWSVVGAGDINGDGKDDLLWHNRTVQRFDYWIMNGSGRQAIASGPVASRYFVVASGDYNGDGRLDIVWTSDDRDVLWMWRSEPDGSLSVHQIAAHPPTGWKLVLEPKYLR